MSQSNTLAAKRRRSVAGAERKEAAAERLPFDGLAVDKRMVLNHRYLRANGLPHSRSTAAVLLPPRHEPVGSLPWFFALLAMPLLAGR
jgi:hypothetical protein